MQRLAIGPEHRPDAGGLCGCNADRAFGAVRIETHEMRARRRGGEGPDRAGAVKAVIVMRRRHIHADARTGLISGNEGFQHLPPGRLALLGQRQQRRQDHHTGMR
jgi:hypothetical protein